MDEASLTTEQIERLQAAIDRARLPGIPVYVEGGEPACVIGQLGALEGISTERMEKWKGGVTALAKTAPELLAYPRFLLDHLQLGWSDPWRTEEQCRARLRERLQRWLDGERGGPWDEWREKRSTLEDIWY